MVAAATPAVPSPTLCHPCALEQEGAAALSTPARSHTQKRILNRPPPPICSPCRSSAKSGVLRGGNSWWGGAAAAAAAATAAALTRMCWMCEEEGGAVRAVRAARGALRCRFACCARLPPLQGPFPWSCKRVAKAWAASSQQECVCAIHAREAACWGGARVRGGWLLPRAR